MVNSMENYNDISCDTAQGKTDWHYYVWWSTISILTLDKISDGSQYGELQLYHF